MGTSRRDLTVDFSHLDRDRLLDAWNWLVDGDQVPILVSAIGDVFLQDVRDGSIQLLDVTVAEVCPITPDLDTFKERLAEREFALSHLAAEAVADLRAGGLVLAPGQVYSWREPPVLEGDYEYAQVEVDAIDRHFARTGLIQREARRAAGRFTRAASESRR